MLPLRGAEFVGRGGRNRLEDRFSLIDDEVASVICIPVSNLVVFWIVVASSIVDAPPL